MIDQGTTITAEQLEQAIEDGYTRRPAEWITSPRVALSDAIGTWTLSVQDAFWPRHECNDGDSSCPSAPDSERDLSKLYSATTRAIEADCIALIRQRLREMVEGFAAEHPGAQAHAGHARPATDDHAMPTPPITPVEQLRQYVREALEDAFEARGYPAKESPTDA